MTSPDTLFNTLSDATRLRILMLIQRQGELCVCEIMQALEESQPKISRHLAFMRKHGIVSARREGTWMHYRVNSELPSWARKILSDTHTQLHSLATFKRDSRKLSTMTDRPEQKCA